jgi:hypothetical protein
MKLTKEQLKRIILEELELAEDVPPAPPEGEAAPQDEETKSKQELRQVLLNMSRQIPMMQGLSTDEIRVFSALIQKALQAAEAGNATVPLNRAIDRIEA